jgi:hypothetical protein
MREVAGVCRLLKSTREGMETGALKALRPGYAVFMVAAAGARDHDEPPEGRGSGLHEPVPEPRERII